MTFCRKQLSFSGYWTSGVGGAPWLPLDRAGCGEQETGLSAEPVRPTDSLGVHFPRESSSQHPFRRGWRYQACRQLSVRALASATRCHHGTNAQLSHLHLVPGKHTDSLAKPKPTEPASVRNIRGPPPLPLPGDSQTHRVGGSVTVSVPINVPPSGLSEAGD